MSDNRRQGRSSMNMFDSEDLLGGGGGGGTTTQSINFRGLADDDVVGMLREGGVWVWRVGREEESLGKKSPPNTIGVSHDHIRTLRHCVANLVDGQHVRLRYQRTIVVDGVILEAEPLPEEHFEEVMVQVDSMVFLLPNFWFKMRAVGPVSGLDAANRSSQFTQGVAAQLFVLPQAPQAPQSPQQQQQQQQFQQQQHYQHQQQQQQLQFGQDMASIQQQMVNFLPVMFSRWMDCAENSLRSLERAEFSNYRPIEQPYRMTEPASLRRRGAATPRAAAQVVDDDDDDDEDDEGGEDHDGDGDDDDDDDEMDDEEEDEQPDEADVSGGARKLKGRKFKATN